MPRIKDLFDGQIRSVSDDIYAQYIQIPSRFQAVRDDEESDVTVIHEEPVTSASDLVGKGLEQTEKVAESIPKGPLVAMPPVEFNAAPTEPPTPPEPATPETIATET